MIQKTIFNKAYSWELFQESKCCLSQKFLLQFIFTILEEKKKSLELLRLLKIQILSYPHNRNNSLLLLKSKWVVCDQSRWINTKLRMQMTLPMKRWAINALHSPVCLLLSLTSFSAVLCNTFFSLLHFLSISVGNHHSNNLK